MPVTQLTTPSGKPASDINFINSRVEADVNSDGLTTAVLPAASAGASFQDKSNKGEFHAVIIPTTPNGSYFVKLKIPGLSDGNTAPSTLSASPPKYLYHSARYLVCAPISAISFPLS